MFGRRRRGQAAPGGPDTDDHDAEISFALRAARGLLADYAGTGEKPYLDEAIAAGRHALRRCPADAPQRYAALLVLAQALEIRYDAAGSDQDLEDSVTVFRELVELVPGDDLDTSARLLQKFAVHLLDLASVTGRPRPAEEAVLVARRLDAVAAASGAGDLRLVAARILSTAASLLPPDHPDQPALAALFAAAVVTGIRQQGALELSVTVADGAPSRATLTVGDELIATAGAELERALRLCPPGDPNRLPFLGILADVRALQYEYEPSAEHLEALLDVSRQVLDLYPPDHPVTVGLLHNLGIGLRDRYTCGGVVADLDEAAQVLRMAAARAPDADGRARAEAALAEVIALRDSRVEPAAATTAEWTWVAGPNSEPERAIGDRGDDVRELAAHSAGLMNLLEQYEITGDVALLDRIRRDGHALLAGLRSGDPNRWLVAVPLGPALARRFEALGEPDDLNEAVDLLREALRRPTISPDDLINDLRNLAMALTVRFLHDRSGADIDEAITLGRRAVELAPAGSPGHSRHLSGLGSALLHRFQHAGGRFDLDEAIEVGGRALQTAQSPAEVAHARDNLAIRLRERFQLDGDPADLDRAVEQLRNDVPDPRHDQNRRLMLALTLRDRAGATGADDLPEAARLCRALLDTVAPQSPQHLVTRLALAQVLTDLGRSDEAVAVLSDVGRTGAGPSFDRMDALVHLANLRADGADRAAGEIGEAGEIEWDAATEAFSDAITELQLIVWRGLRPGDRSALLTRWPGVSGDAAAAAIGAGQAQRAVELLEHGRSLLWGQALDTRADLTALQSAHPDLAERLTALRAESDAQAWTDPRRGTDAGERRRRLAHEWDAAVGQVRSCPGFEHFLSALPFTEVAEAAAGGPVVLVNVSRLRCDALVVTPGGVGVVPLPDLTLESALERTRRYLDVVSLVSVGGAASGVREQVLLSFLEWLWDVVAAPVLAMVPAGSRVWWCPTGPLSLAPLHAAGHHDPDDALAATVHDRVVSSTTPTLRSLLHARRPLQTPARAPLVVACPERPGYVSGLADLPSAAREADLLRDRFPDSMILTGASATRARVRELLPQHSSVHFACHGESGPPDRAGLFLADARLTLADVAGLDLAGGQLAVLSACHTAMGDAEVPDESGHLAAALQIAGFRQVISTLWAIGDDTALTVTDGLYRELTSSEGTVNPARAAVTLRSLVLELRRRNPYTPSIWAPFVHFGA